MKHEKSSSDLLYADLSYEIIGVAMEVHNSLGPGWDEVDYHNAMIVGLEARGLEVQSLLKSSLEFEGVLVDRFELDLMVNNKVVLELKNLRSGFHPANYVQIVNYLKHWDIRLGILINFGQNRLHYDRVPRTQTEVSVNSMPCTGGMPAESLVSANLLHCSVEKIMSDVGYGYGVETFSQLLFVALQQKLINVTRLVVNPAYHGLKLGEREVDCFLLNDKMLASVSASGKIGSASDLATMKSYIKHSGIPVGILVDIGSRVVEFKVVA